MNEFSDAGSIPAISTNTNLHGWLIHAGFLFIITHLLTHQIAVRYGLVIPNPKHVVFYFEKTGEQK